MASIANPLNISTMPFLAGGAITINRLVKFDTTAGRVVQGAANTDVICGVAEGVQVSPTSSTAGTDSVAVRFHGVALVEAGAATSLSDPIMSDTSGRAITATSGKPICGIGLAAATGAGSLIPVLLFVNPSGKVVV